MNVTFDTDRFVSGFTGTEGRAFQALASITGGRDTLRISQLILRPGGAGVGRNRGQADGRNLRFHQGSLRGAKPGAGGWLFRALMALAGWIGVDNLLTGG